MSDAERARLKFNDEADARFVGEADRLVREGTAEWVEDPWVDDVGALVLSGTNTALVVVYLDRDDFEASDDFEDLVD